MLNAITAKKNKSFTLPEILVYCDHELRKLTKTSLHFKLEL